MVAYDDNLPAGWYDKVYIHTVSESPSVNLNASVFAPRLLAV